MFIIDHKSSIPVFIQIEKQIIEFISVGVLSKNEQLPSVRTVAVDLGINPNTVSKAYRELEENGYVYSLKGKGCFVSGQTNMTDKIKNELLVDFKESVERMQKHNISKEELMDVIERMYQL